MKKKSNSEEPQERNEERTGGSAHNGESGNGKGNSMPHLPDRVLPDTEEEPKEVPHRKAERKAPPHVPDDGGLAEDDPQDEETRA
jgi:hypothetical protein